jgi:KipI family sensor histidine kinase inhibitor
MPARILEAGDSALLLELDEVIDEHVNARAIAIADVVRGERLPGVRDVVSTFRSVALFFDPLVVDIAAVRGVLERASTAPGEAATGRSIEVPVTYGGEFGPDLSEVAAFAALTPEEVIRRHAETTYRVFMLGFLPGFAYMGRVRSEIAAPRRPTPRLKVPRGSVGVAGLQTAVYPRDSPGGWQLIGRTPLDVFDPNTEPAALFAPGDSVRFVPESVVSAFRRTSEVVEVRQKPDSTYARSITVLRPGLFTTVQDSGRWGHQSSGVSVSGALDAVSHRMANALVGNDRDAATLEMTIAGPELRVDGRADVAVSGADLGATIDGAPLALNVPARCTPGSVLRFSGRRAGARAYLAFGGGITVPTVLGSRATHALTGLGGIDGRPLSAGDRIPLGARTGTPSRRRPGISSSISREGVRVRVLRGPQHEFFSDAAFNALQRSRFRISSQSDRMGFRLQGARIPRTADREMISDVTFTGAIQVPPSGEPILLMADRQTTGGYPQVAVVITADLPLAAQLAPGDWIEFQICSRAEALSALVAQEGKLLALG